jgi:transposase
LIVGLRLYTERITITEPVRLLEVFTGVGRRRTWRDEAKARIVAEIATSGDSVCAVARRHGLSPQQLFGWRRQLRETDAGRSEAGGLQLVPTVVDVGSSPVPQRRAPRCKAEASAGMIEVETNGVTIRVGRGADVETLMVVLRGLKAGA